MSSDIDNAIFLKLGILEGKLDAHLSKAEAQDDTLRNHDERLRILEAAKGKIYGIATLIGFCASIFGDNLSTLFTKG